MPELEIGKLFKTTEELCDPEEVEINGNVPLWVSGTFLRLGPGCFDLPGNFTMNHYLDGYSVISKFEINENKVKFSKKFLQSDSYKRALVAKKPVVCEFGTRAYPDFTKGVFSRLISSLIPIELTDNDQLSLFKINNEIFVSSETCYFHSIDPSNLETGERFNTWNLFGLNICIAHPMVDHNGVTFNIGLTVLSGFKYHIFSIPPPSSPKQTSKDLFKRAKILCTIPSRWKQMMSYTHSFGMTKNYIIFIEQPYVMLVSKAICSIVKQHSFKDFLEFRPDLQNRFYIIEKATGKVIKIEYLSVKPFFFLHIINSYEDSDSIIIDITAYPNASVVENLALDKLRNGIFNEGKQPACHRYVLPLVSDLKNVPEKINLVEVKSSAVAIRKGNSILLTPEIVTASGFEFPTISSKYSGKKYQYFYAAGSGAPGFFEHSISKVDTVLKEVTLWKGSGGNARHLFPGEPIFIPNPNCTNEDDGIIVATVSDIRPGAKDFIVFLDAKSMTQIGSAKFKAHIPQLLHGIFLPK